MNDNVLYLRKKDLEIIEKDGFLELNIRKGIPAGAWLRLEFEPDEPEDDVKPSID